MMARVLVAADLTPVPELEPTLVEAPAAMVPQQVIAQQNARSTLEAHHSARACPGTQPEQERAKSSRRSRLSVVEQDLDRALV